MIAPPPDIDPDPLFGQPSAAERRLGRRAALAILTAIGLTLAVTIACILFASR